MTSKYAILITRDACSANAGRGFSFPAILLCPVLHAQQVFFIAALGILYVQALIISRGVSDVTKWKSKSGLQNASLLDTNINSKTS